jgi:hypothetical protein
MKSVKSKILENTSLMCGMEKFLENILEELTTVTVLIVAMIGSRNVRTQILLESGN